MDVFIRNEVTSYRMKSYFRYYKLLSRYIKLIVFVLKNNCIFFNFKEFKENFGDTKPMIYQILNFYTIFTYFYNVYKRAIYNSYFSYMLSTC